MHGAGLDTAAAANAGRVGGDLVLIARKRQHRARALGNREVGRRLRHTHHRAAGDELECLVLQTAAGIEEERDWRADRAL